MESRTHNRLKRLAVAFLRRHGSVVAVATEVQCPIARYRVDVAGYADRPSDADRSWKRRGGKTRTIFIECKRSRSDFLRDGRDQERLLRRRSDLDRFRRVLEEQRIKSEEPHLRRSEAASLFADLDEWDFSASRLPAYRDLLRRLRRLDAMIHGETKFCMTARYALADRLYVAAPVGLIARHEVPPGWGLLVCSRRALREDEPDLDLFGEAALRMEVPAPRLHPRPEFRHRVLRNIAVAASRSV